MNLDRIAMTLGLASQAVFIIIIIGWVAGLVYRWIEKRAKWKKAASVALLVTASLNFVFLIYMLVTV